MAHTIISLFEESVTKYPHNPLIWEKQDGLFSYLSYSDVRKRVLSFAAGLIEQGVQPGDRIALIAEGSVNWLVSELGMLYIGAINVPLSIKLNAEEVAFRVRHSGAKIVICSKLQFAKVEPLLASVDTLEGVILFDRYDGAHPSILPIAAVNQQGNDALASKPDMVSQRAAQVQPTDYANICYTSGTTADPKGIILSHRNYTANVEQALSQIFIPEDYVALHILPWDHSFAHTAGLFVFMKLGAAFAAVQVGKTPMEALKNIPINIKEIRPHVLLSVPALAKNFRKNIEQGIASKGVLVKALFNLGLSVGYAYNGLGCNKGQGWRVVLKPVNWLFVNTLFKAVRKSFGGRMKFFVGGGALLDIELQRFFAAVGMPMYQGYGLSEASPIISVNAPKKHKFGSSGVIVRPMDLKICDEEGNSLPQGQSGEIVIRGENVMVGYWENPSATQEALREGWLYTGDLGYVDRDGFLYVLGRTKSLLIGDDGEKYSPELIEEAMVGQTSYLEQSILYNNQNPYVVALLVPNKEALKRHLKKMRLRPDSEEGVKAALDKLQQKLKEYRTGGKYADLFPQRWLPAAFAVLDQPFTEQNGMMNSTMKMVRRNVEQAYAEQLEFLYTPEAKNIHHKWNMEVMARLLRG